MITRGRELGEQRQQPVAAHGPEVVVDRAVVLVEQAREREIARPHRRQLDQLDAAADQPGRRRAAARDDHPQAARAAMARARVAARLRWPVPSRCWTQNRTGIV